jgi:hypothetical protein
MSGLQRILIIVGLAVVVFGGLFWAISRPPADTGPTVQVLYGDPRMKLCANGPVGVPFATPENADRLNATAPLVRDMANRGEYRITIFRPSGEPSLSVRLWTPATASARAEVRIFNVPEVGELRTQEEDVAARNAGTIITTLENARIWGQPSAIPAPKQVITGPGTAVLEIKAEGVDRCITTRYDDERLRPILMSFASELAPFFANQPLDLLVPAEQRILRPAATP